MARNGQQLLLLNFKFILLLLILLESVATTPVVNLPKPAAATKKNDTACKFLFHVKGGGVGGTTGSGQFQVTGITMPPTLEKMLKQADKTNNNGRNKLATNCVPEFMVEQNYYEKSSKLKNAKKQRKSSWSIFEQNSDEDSSEEDIYGTLIDDSQPLYEQQEVVYPSDVEPIVQQTSATSSTTPIPITTTTTKSTTTTRSPSTTKRTPTTTTTSSSSSTSTSSSIDNSKKPDVKVEENYRYYQADGTGEYKLALSNGMTNYKRIYKKKVGDKEIIAQSGYYTVPRDDAKNGFEIHYYVADENGQRVYTDKS